MTMQVVVVTQASDVPLAPVDGKPTLVYWKIHGLAKAVRLTLAVALGEQQDWVDVQIDAGQDPSDPGHRQAWIQAKEHLHDVLDFPNLPYYMDDQVKLSQSDTILRYLGRKHSLMGTPGQEHVVDMVLDEIKDLDGTLVGFCYVKGREACEHWFENFLPAVLKRFERLVHDTTKTYLTGDQLSIADLKLYAFVYKLIMLHEHFVGGGADPATFVPTALWAWVQRIEAVPAVQAYVNYLKSQPLAMNNPSAKVLGSVA